MRSTANASPSEMHTRADERCRAGALDRGLEQPRSPHNAQSQGDRDVEQGRKATTRNVSVGALGQTFNLEAVNPKGREDDPCEPGEVNESGITSGRYAGTLEA